MTHVNVFTDVVVDSMESILNVLGVAIARIDDKLESNSSAANSSVASSSQEVAFSGLVHPSESLMREFNIAIKMPCGNFKEVQLLEKALQEKGPRRVVVSNFYLFYYYYFFY